MPRKNPPLLYEGPLSRSVFVATRYRVTGKTAANGQPIIDVQEKFDVTEEFEALVAQRAERGGRDV